MYCGSCKRDLHPSIEGNQEGRFVYTCPCGSYIGDVDRSRHGVPAAAAQVAGPAAPAPAARPPELRGELIVAQATIEEQIRARLAYLEDGHVEAEQAERRRLRRMLTASERRPKRKTNVVPIARQAAK